MDCNKHIHLMVKEISAPHLFIKKILKIEPKNCAIQGQKRVLLLTPFLVKKHAFSDLDIFFPICEENQSSNSSLCITHRNNGKSM